MRGTMKFIYIILAFGFFTLLDAEMSIDTQIQNIKSAPPAKRVEMMNALKMQLSTMNSQDRSATIAKMRSQIRSRRHNANTPINTQSEHARENINEHAQNSQSDSIQQMDNIERMNQNHAGEEYINDEYMNNDIINQNIINDSTIISPIDDSPDDTNEWINR